MFTLYLVAVNAQAETWPIKEFVLVHEYPDTVINQLNAPGQILNDVIADDLTEEQITEIQNWLRQVAYELEGLGFQPPRYEVLTSDGKAFKVFVHTFDGIARALTDCTDEENIVTHIAINPEGIVKNGVIHAKAYQDIAHELFHTVQYSYPMFQGDCSQGYWILEGTAEAVGIEMARTLKGIKPYTACQIGMRSYAARLYVDNPKPADRDPPCNLRRTYQTQSFWQFLGEYSFQLPPPASGENSSAKQLRWGKGRPRPERFVPPDFGYLHTLFSTPHGGHTQKSEYRWLDAGIQEHFGFPLSVAYSTFAGTFSGYHHADRLKLYNTSGSYKARLKSDWHRWAFNSCEPVSLSQSTKPVVIPPQNINAIASRCLKLTFDFSGQANFKIIAEGGGTALSDLTVLAQNGETLVRPALRPQGAVPTDATFQFSIPVKKDVAEVFIVTNVNADAELSKKQSPKMKVVFSTASSSLAKPKKSTLPRPEKAAKGSKEETHWEINAGMESQSWYASVSQNNNGNCDFSRKGRVCGPHTSISLSIVPDTLMMMQESMQPGMYMERRTNLLRTLEERGPGKTINDIIEANKVIAETEGTSIGITIPKIDYGFVGSFTNAAIDSNKGDSPDNPGNSGSYQARGPARIGDCRDGYFPLSGQVTIIEATRQVLRGSYSAKLIDEELANDMDCPQQLPVHTTISGTFSIANPQLGDKVENAELPENIGEHAINQINQIIPGMYTGELGELVREKIEQKQREKAARKQAKLDGTSIVPCDCSCNKVFDNYMNRRPCFMDCENKVQHCETLEELHELIPQSATHTGDQSTEIAVLRNEFETMLNRLVTDPGERQSYLKGFDAMPDLSMKQQVAANIETLLSRLHEAHQ